jgi:hypothetical protein
MQRPMKNAFRFLLIVVIIAGLASLFPVTAELFERLPYWALNPLRILAAIFLVFMLTGFLLNSSVLQRFIKK